jgi:hypothetical protein
MDDYLTEFNYGCGMNGYISGDGFGDEYLNYFYFGIGCGLGGGIDGGNHIYSAHIKGNGFGSGYSDDFDYNIRELNNG